jgi:hypothetical protein
MMNASSMGERPLSTPYHFENEFQFQLYRIAVGRQLRQRARSPADVIGITKGLDPAQNIGHDARSSAASRLQTQLQLPDLRTSNPASPGTFSSLALLRLAPLRRFN